MNLLSRNILTTVE